MKGTKYGKGSKKFRGTFVAEARIVLPKAKEFTVTRIQ